MDVCLHLSILDLFLSVFIFWNMGTEEVCWSSVWLYKLDALLTRIRFPGVAWDFSQRVNSQCRFSYGINTARMCDCTHQHLCAPQKSQTPAATPLFRHIAVMWKTWRKNKRESTGQLTLWLTWLGFGVAFTVPGCVHVCLHFAVGVGSSGVCMFHVLILTSILVLNWIRHYYIRVTYYYY